MATCTFVPYRICSFSNAKEQQVEKKVIEHIKDDVKSSMKSFCSNDLLSLQTQIYNITKHAHDITTCMAKSFICYAGISFEETKTSLISSKQKYLRLYLIHQSTDLMSTPFDTAKNVVFTCNVLFNDRFSSISLFSGLLELTVPELEIYEIRTFSCNSNDKISKDEGIWKLDIGVEAVIIQLILKNK